MKLHSILALCVLSVAFILPAGAAAETVSVPLSLEYGLLRALVVQNAFTDEGQSAVIVDDAEGCTEITVSEPQFFTKNGRFHSEFKVKVKAGKSFMSYCFFPVAWEGYLQLMQQPMLDNGKQMLSFKTLDSEVFDKDHEPTIISDIVWKLIRSWVFNYVEDINIHLGPPVQDLKGFLLPCFVEDEKLRAQALLESLRLSTVRTEREGLRVELLLDVPDMVAPAPDEETETITRAEIELFMENWEAFDAFLIHIITSLAEKELTEDDRDLLMAELLDARYALSEQLAEQTYEQDFVRERFILAWNALSPIFRRHLGKNPSENVLGYLAFLSASDALSALDEAGPSLGVEISRDGLIRLARFLGEGELIIDPDQEVNQKLRDVLGLGEALEFSGPGYAGDEIEAPPLDAPLDFPDEAEESDNSTVPESTQEEQRSEEPGQTGDGNDALLPQLKTTLLKDIFTYFAIREAFAAEPLTENAPAYWLPHRNDLLGFVEKVRGLLDRTADEVLKKRKLETRYNDFYHTLSYAVAWQESCFRQFVRNKKGNITYIRSYNGSSVGLMQINEYVWKSIYNLRHLRWDVHYNVRAGSEILRRYLDRYALRRLKKRNMIDDIDNRTLAGLVYSMYNGGPGQFNKYMKRIKSNKFYLSDNLFIEKYDWVVAEEWERIRKCLIGD